VTSIDCNGNVVSNSFTDHILTIQNGDISNVTRVECDEMVANTFTDSVINIQNGNISNVNQISTGNVIANNFNGNDITSEKIACSTFTDGKLVVNNGWISGIKGIDDTINIKNGAIRNVEIIESTSFTDGHLYINEGNLQNVDKIETNEIEFSSMTFKNNSIVLNKIDVQQPGVIDIYLNDVKYELVTHSLLQDLQNQITQLQNIINNQS